MIESAWKIAHVRGKSSWKERLSTDNERTYAWFSLIQFGKPSPPAIWRIWSLSIRMVAPGYHRLDRLEGDEVVCAHLFNHQKLQVYPS